MATAWRALGCSKAAAKLCPRVPILPGVNGTRGVLPVPIPAPPSALLGWRCLPGALRPPHTLPAVCFQFLLASAPPCLLPIKKRGKKYPRHLLGARLPEAPVSWGCAGGDGGCRRCSTSLLVPFCVGSILQYPCAQVFLL